MRLFLTVLSFSIITITSWSQSFEWVKQIAGTSDDNVYGMHLDSTGNIYLIGTFLYNFDADPGPGVLNLTSTGSNSIFLAKYTNNGDLLWAKNFGGSSSFNNRGYDITTDSAGNVYGVGRFYNNGNFDPGFSDTTVASSGQQDAFLIKFDENGIFQWVRTVGGGSSDVAKGVEIQQNGNVVVVGEFSTTADMDPGPGTLNFTSNGSRDVFVSEFTPQGDLVYARQIGGPSSIIVGGLARDDNDNIVFGGYFGSTVDFDPGNGTFELISNSGVDSYIVKLDGNGDFVFAKSFVTDNWGEIMELTTDHSGDIYGIGLMGGNTNFDVGVSDTTIYSSGDGTYVIKLQANGDLSWVKGFPNDNWHSANGIAVDNLNRVYVTGEFADTTDFNPDAGVNNLISAGGVDAYLVKLDQDGSYLWTRQFSGNQSVSGKQVLVDNDFSILTTGGFAGTVDFNLETGPDTLVSLGSLNPADVYLHKLSQCAPEYYSESITACDSYLWWNGETYTNDTITDYVQFVTAQGCDSLIRLELTINETPSNSVTQNANEFNADAVGVSYQWIDCLDDQPVMGETMQQFIASSVGEYAVIVDNNGCTDTSDCLIYSDLSTAENELHNMKLYPNPTNGSFTVKLQGSAEFLDVSIFNYTGEVVFGHEIKNGEQINLHQAAGVYIVEVTSGSGIQRRKLIIQ